MRKSVEIQNLKCGGCGTTITNKMNSLEDVSNVLVDVEQSTVSFEYQTEVVLMEVQKTLSKLGYPLVSDKNTFGHKTKSYISCAIGKMGN